MFRRKKVLRSDSLYISFLNKEGKMTHEYIPRDATRLRRWLEKRRRAAYRKYGIEDHYGNIRHVLIGDGIKIEDIAFIIHVLEQHNGNPEYSRERWLYNKLQFLYHDEIEQFIKPYIEYEKKGSAITHPYGRAYYKRWIMKQNADLKRMYHGVNSDEVIEMADALIEKIDRRIKRNQDKQRYYDNKLKEDLAKKKE